MFPGIGSEGMMMRNYLGGNMGRVIRTGADRVPIMLGMAMLTVTVGGLIGTFTGKELRDASELLVAGIGMLVGLLLRR